MYSKLSPPTPKLLSMFSSTLHCTYPEDDGDILLSLAFLLLLLLLLFIRLFFLESLNLAIKLFKKY